jgi:hypothetical protein
MTSSTASLRVLAALAFTSLLALLAAEAATATHVRPKGATPLRVSLVPAQQQCTTPNGAHDPPLDHLRSCLPPAQTASAATVGTPDANSFPAQSEGFVHITVINVATAAEDDRVEVEITDVREIGAPANDYNPNPLGPDMTLVAQIPAPPATTPRGDDLRLTDHRNIGPGPAGGAGTVIDFDFPIPVDCNDTPSLSIGSTCGVVTTFNTILPGFVKFDPTSPNRNRQTIEIGQVQVFDAGLDKVRGTNDDTLFEVQGIWNP